MKEFKCRASAAGELLTNPRKGEAGLSKTTVSLHRNVDKGTVVRCP